MKLTANNLVCGGSTIRFVVWSRRGQGMVNVYVPGDSGGHMMSVEAAREYWQKAIREWGYRRGDDSVVEPY